MKNEFVNKNFYKLCVLVGLILVTLITFLVKNTELGIEWEIFGFIGVIVTIIVSENSRIKQNEYEFKKEKIKMEVQVKLKVKYLMVFT